MTTLPVLLKSFLTYLEVERGFSPNTVDAYQRDCEQFLMSLAETEEGDDEAETPAAPTPPRNPPRELVTARSVFDFLVRERKRGREPSSIRRSLSALRTFFKFLVRERVLDENPATTIETPKMWKNLPKVLEEKEVERLLQAVVDHPSRYPLRDRALLELMYASGLRVSEACTLELDNIREDLGILHCHGKGSKERVVPVSKAALEAIRAYVEEERPRLLKQKTSSLVFVTRSGNEIGREVVNNMIRKYSQLAGLPGIITPHTLRHSLATHLLRGGADLRVVQEILGHVNLQTTEIYTHIEKSDLKEQHRKFHPRG